MDYVLDTVPDTTVNRRLRSWASIFEGRTMFIVSDPWGSPVSIEGSRDAAGEACHALNSKLFDTGSESCYNGTGETR